MTREDLARFCAMKLDFESIGLIQERENTPYFCTPLGAEYVGWIGCDGVHFILLPGDERVFCVDPAMGEPGSYVLPVAENFRTFLSYVLFCRDANPLSQIWWLPEERFRKLLAEDAEADWPGCEELLARKAQTLECLRAEFSIAPVDPYEAVKALQADFDPDVLTFSSEYYETLGL